MTDETEEAIALLRNIRENQQQSLALQRESLELQRKAVEGALTQYARADAVNAKAEQIQARSAELIAMSRRTMKVILPIIVVLLLYLSWLMFRRYL